MWSLLQNPYELIATLTGIASVYFSYKKNILTYFFGLISVVLYVFLCYSAGIYADMGINIFYFFMSIYGWWNWSQLKIENKKFVIFQLTKNQSIFYLCLSVITFGIIYFILVKFTDSTIPIWDSITTALFIVGMILMSKKFLENWIYLLIGNLISIPIYYYKELYVSSVLYIFLSLFAVIGYLNWRKVEE